MTTDTTIEADAIETDAAAPAPAVTNSLGELDRELARRLEKLRQLQVVAPNSTVRAVLEGRMEAIIMHRNVMTAVIGLGDYLAELRTKLGGAA